MAWRCGVETAWCEEGGVVRRRQCNVEKEVWRGGVVWRKHGAKKGVWCR